MPIYKDPVTQQRVLHQASCTDIQYLVAEGDPAVTEEVLPVIGPWVDYTGSGGVNSRTQQMFGGTENKFFGEEENIRQGNLDVTGNQKGVTRRRQIRRYVDLKKK